MSSPSLPAGKQLVTVTAALLVAVLIFGSGAWPLGLAALALAVGVRAVVPGLWAWPPWRSRSVCALWCAGAACGMRSARVARSLTGAGDELPREP